MAASQDRSINSREIHLIKVAGLPVAAATRVYARTFLGKNGASYRPLVAGDEFAGLTRAQVDNRDGAAGDLRVKAETGIEIEHAVTGVTGPTNERALVYASDDQTLTLTASGNSPAGIIIEHISSTRCWVHLFTAAEIAAL